MGGQALNTHEQDDAILIDRLAKGDADAIAPLYDQYGRFVYALALRILHEPATAEEITQEVFVRLWRSAASFQREKGTVQNWLLRIAHNLALNEIRRRQSRPVAAEAFDWDGNNPRLTDTDRAIDPAAAIWLNERARTIRLALAQLPAPQRQAIELAFYGGLSQAEIAAALGDPLGTVKSRIRLGMQRLRELLVAAGIDVQSIESS